MANNGPYLIAKERIKTLLRALILEKLQKLTIEGNLMKTITLGLVFSLLWVSAVDAKPKNIKIINHRLETKLLDLGQQGMSMGDISINSGEILSSKSGEVIGSYVTRKIVVDVQAGQDVRDTVQQNNLPTGTVTTMGISVTDTRTGLVMSSEERAIVGGTRAYAGARGVARITPLLDKPGYTQQEFIFK
jgi:hypothetical protein